VPNLRNVFTDWARAVIKALGWPIEYVQERARRALKQEQPEDYGFCDFKLPIREQAFRGSPLDHETVEIDAHFTDGQLDGRLEANALWLWWRTFHGR
jgi:hypothetical protein